MWDAWQLSVLAIGFTCSDHRHPGSNVARPTPPPSMWTSWSWPLPSSNGRVSSGESKLLRMRLATLTSCCGYSCLRDEGLERRCCCLLRHVLGPPGRHVKNPPQSIRCGTTGLGPGEPRDVLPEFTDHGLSNRGFGPADSLQVAVRCQRALKRIF